MDFVRASDQPIETNIQICAGLFVKHMIFAVDTYIPQHAHAYEHLSVIAAGAVRVWADGALLGDYAAPAGLVIKPGVKHLFQALQPGTAVLCIHRVDDDGEPVITSEHHIVRE